MNISRKQLLPRATRLPVQWLALPNILGVHELASGRAAILGFTMPIWTVLLAIAFFGEKLTRRAVISEACGSAAVGLLVAHEVTALAGPREPGPLVGTLSATFIVGALPRTLDFVAAAFIMLAIAIASALLPRCSAVVRTA